VASVSGSCWEAVPRLAAASAALVRMSVSEDWRSLRGERGRVGLELCTGVKVVKSAR
jgi:hypothetical protein